MSIATPPQLVQWAARTGHSVVAAKLTAGKAAAGKAAAGTGLGGGLGGSALKVGAIAVTVGGVAAGVPPIRQALVPSRPPVAAHRHHAPRAVQPSLAVAVSSPLTRAASPGKTGGSGAAGPRAAVASTHRRHDVRAPGPLLIASVGESHAVVTGASTPSAPAPAQAPPATDRTVPTNASTSSPVAQSAAALLAWWLTHRPSSAASETTSTAGRAPGQEHGSGATSPTIDHSQPSGCDPTGTTGPTGATSSPSSTPPSQSFGGAGSGWVGGREAVTATSNGDRNAVTGGPATGLAGGGAGEPNRRAVSACDMTPTGSSGRSGG